MIKKIVFVIICCCFASLSLSLIQVANGEKSLPSVFGFSAMTVISGSMEPTIHVGDYIVIQEIQRDGVAVGDVITFKDGESFVTHRVIETLSATEFITQGDANNTPDLDTVKIEDVVGIQVLSIPKVGDFLLWVKTPLGIGSVLALSLAFIWLPSNRKPKATE